MRKILKAVCAGWAGGADTGRLDGCVDAASGGCFEGGLGLCLLGGFENGDDISDYKCRISA